VETAQVFRLPSGRSINLIAGPVFVATKLEAFKGRGRGDFLASHDIEDIVTVVDGRESLISEAEHSPVELRDYLATEIGRLTASDEFLDSLAGHLPGDAGSQSRLPSVIERLRAITSL
jgi:hypothetical protein